MASPRRLLLLSNSTLHPTGYLEYARNHITDFLRKGGVNSVLFVPYALKDHQHYADVAKVPFEEWGFNFSSIHTAAEPRRAVAAAEAIFIGGGNTFRLLKALYDNDLVEIIRQRVLHEGLLYIGSSAGTNVATASINTTNDMPIVYPPTFKALDLVPFNINPHYLDADTSSTHQGETRERRIRQYQELPDVPPVLALREGSILHVEGRRIHLKGEFDALLFRGDNPPTSYPKSTDFSFLL